jgi:heme A synthase
MPTESSNQSIGDLIVHLTSQASTLVRQEITLAQAEMRQNAMNLQRDLAGMIVGGVILFAGFLALIGTGIAALTQVVPLWQAGLIVGGGTALVGIIVMLVARGALSRANLLPRKTLNNLAPSSAKGAKA